MIGIVLVAHAPLASALASAARHVYCASPQMATEQVRALDVVPDCDVAACLAAARAAVAAVDTGSGVLVMTDAFGATPGNVATQLGEAGRTEVIAGVNLPMLLRTLCYRKGKLSDLVEKAIAGGAQGVMRVALTPVQNQYGRTTPDDPTRIHNQ